MAYEAWSVVAGEQPTAAKWNILGDNDAAFHDGSGFDDEIIVDRHYGSSSIPTRAYKDDSIPKEALAGGIWLDTISLSSTGTLNYTSCPFQPQSLIIEGRRTSSGAHLRYSGVAFDNNGSITQEGRSSVTGGGGTPLVTTNDSSAAFYGTGSDGSTDVRGELIEMLSNGISVNVTTSAGGTTGSFLVMFFG